jgi:hypothetical protein
VSLPQQLLSSDEGGSTPVAVITRTGFFSFSRGKVRGTNVVQEPSMPSLSEASPSCRLNSHLFAVLVHTSSRG